jgi:hypothetical protein
MNQSQDDTQTPSVLESFQVFLENAWLENALTDATSMRLHAFVSDGARVTDRVLQHFDSMLLEFRQERVDQQTKIWELESMVNNSILARLGKITANMNAIVSMIAENCVALTKTFAMLSDTIADNRRIQHAVNAQFDASLTHLAERLQNHDAQIVHHSDPMDQYD